MSTERIILCLDEKYKYENKTHLIGGWPTPLKNMSQIGSSSQLLGKIKFMFQNVPNHQPDTLELLTYSNIQRWLTKNWDTKDPTDGFLGKRSTLTSHPAGLCKLETISCSNHWVEASIPDEIRVFQQWTSLDLPHLELCLGMYFPVLSGYGHGHGGYTPIVPQLMLPGLYL